jgi:hypothetical protein
MKFKSIFTIVASFLIATTEFMSGSIVFAEEKLNTTQMQENDYGIVETLSPRFTYIESADIGVYPSASGVTYSMNIWGISEVTGVSGTMTLYKQDTSGNYDKKDSEYISLKGNEFQYEGSFKSYGPGNYKLEFSGTVHAKSGSESVTFRNYNSY